MRVGLDASAAAKANRTGVGQYAARLIAALLEEDPSLEMVLGVRLGRLKRRAHVYRPVGPAASRARVRWFPSFWPGRAFRGCDVAHGPDARLAGGSAPQVVTIHDLFSLKSEAWSDARFRAQKAARYAEASSGAARVLCVSEATGNDVASLLGVPRGRIAVTPLGVDPSFRPLPPADRDPVLRRLQVRPPYALFVGLAQPRKNLEAVATTFGRLAARKDDLTFVLAGEDGYPEGRLQAILKETGATDRIRLLGYAHAGDLRPSSSSRAATRASASRPWRPWRAAAPSWRPTAGRCPRSWARAASCSRPTRSTDSRMPQAACSTTRTFARTTSSAGSLAPASFPGLGRPALPSRPTGPPQGCDRIRPPSGPRGRRAFGTRAARSPGRRRTARGGP